MKHAYSYQEVLAKHGTETPQYKFNYETAMKIRENSIGSPLATNQNKL